MRSEKVFWITFNIETYTSNAIVHNDKMTDCTGTSVHNSIIFILSLSLVTMSTDTFRIFVH